MQAGAGRAPAGMSVPPLIVRVAGLAGSVLEPFSSPLCLSHLEAEAGVRRELEHAQARMVGILDRALPEFGRRQRRFLLAVKRDCFNHRSVERHAGAAEWPRLDELSEGLAGRILRVERRLARAERAFDDLYDRELERETGALRCLLEDRRFLRGVALKSAHLVRKARGLEPAPAAELDRRDRKLQLSLVRFVTRAAAKLSPYSTFTTVALGTVCDGPFNGGFRRTQGDRRELSLLRVARPLLERYALFALGRPPVRRRCTVSFNDTVEPVGPDRHRFLTASCWRYDAERGELRFVPGRRVVAAVAGSMVSALERLLAAGPLAYGELIAALSAEPDGPAPRDAGDLGQRIDELIDLGVLDLRLPWPTHEPHFERRFADLLAGLADEDPALARAAAAAARVADLEGGYADAPAPEDAVADLRRAVAELVGSLEALAPEAPGLRPRVVLYEEVMAVAGGAGAPAEGEWLQLSRRAAREILEPAELISRFAALYNHRHDFLHALAATWRERWPGRREIGFLELFNDTLELWKSYQRFDFSHRHHHSSFDPLGLEATARLDALRLELYDQAMARLEQDADGKRLSCRALGELLEGVPERYGPVLGCSVFVQPADPRGELWVLNRLFEGTGRYLSRYATVMEEPMKSRFVDHFTARSAVEVEGEEAHLLDLLFTHGNMTNVRQPQALRVLEPPGERVEVRHGRVVRLRELTVSLDLERDRFRLLDGEGRRLLPVHLSSSNNMFLPTVLRFLSMFGPYEVRQVFPRPPAEPSGDGEHFQRLTCRRLVIQRRRWVVPCAAAACLLEERGAGAFRRVQRWRQERGIPRRVFLYEQMHRGEGSVRSFKPQYLDLGSPLLLQPFLAIVANNADDLIFEEPLPAFTEFPLDSASQPRAIELQLDGLALTEPVSSRREARGLAAPTHLGEPCSPEHDAEGGEVNVG